MWNQWWGVLAEQEAACQQGDRRARLSSALSWPLFASLVCPEEQKAGLRAFQRRFSGLSSLVILRAQIEYPLTSPMTLAVNKPVTCIRWLWHLMIWNF